MASNNTLHIPLHGVCKAKTYYGLNEKNERQIKFEPPVYQQRYAAVLSVIGNEKWKNQMKKVVLMQKCIIFFRIIIRNDVSDCRIRMRRHEFGCVTLKRRDYRAYCSGKSLKI